MTQSKKKLSIQQAAAYLIRQRKEPMTSQEIVRMAQEKELVRESKAQNPTNSFIQTLERNIRMGIGNHPALQFVYDDLGNRFIDIVVEEGDEHEGDIKTPKKKTENQAVSEQETNPVSNQDIMTNQDIMSNVKLYMIANRLSNEQDAINQLLEFAIKEKIHDTMEKINKMTSGL